MQTAFSHANWAVRALANWAAGVIQWVLQTQVGSDSGALPENAGSGGWQTAALCLQLDGLVALKFCSSLKGRVDILWEVSTFSSELLVIWPREEPSPSTKLTSVSDFHLEPKLALQSSSEEIVQWDAGWVLVSAPAWLPISKLLEMTTQSSWTVEERVIRCLYKGVGMDSKWQGGIESSSGPVMQLPEPMSNEVHLFPQPIAQSRKTDHWS